ncbi:MAG: vanadium-dependent haloperoxidase [Nitrospirae bacterium]|nr:vanadium-dependent haloperoxidase [Nitrospirota bacterium]
MIMRQTRMLLATLVTMLILTPTCVVLADGFSGGIEDTFGPRFRADPNRAPRGPVDSRRRPRPLVDAAGSVQRWNQIAIDATGLDHTPVTPGESRVKYAEQLGPGRSSRAMAIVHLAMFDVLNSIEGEYKSYATVGPAPFGTSMKASIAQAAHDSLVALFPAQASNFDEELAEDLTEIPDGRLKTNGVALGRQTAAAVLAARADDGAQYSEPQVGTGPGNYITSNDPGKWRQDPISMIPLALGAYWGNVTPFVLERGDQFRVPPPPALDSREYAIAFDEVKILGGDGIVTPTTRTSEQTQIGIYWAYDGTPSLCAPPRLYNQIAMRIAKKMGTDRNALELARLLALVNVAMADAGIAVWDSKYHYQYWRPVTGIREADEQTGPTGRGDGNPATVGDRFYSPLGAPASNLRGPNFTPPFPAYPSGHAGFGGALFEMLRNFYRTDRIAFSFVSDEFNGVTRDNAGNVRSLVERRFSSLSQAEKENAQSRIYLGIHWSFDATEGIRQGNRVADYVFKHALHPRYQRGNGR